MGDLDNRPWIVIVGGFLGAGKTSLILAAAGELKKRGLRSAAVFNDQGSRLVDRSHAERTRLLSSEVTGGCFCCRFSDLARQIERLREHSPHVIFAEPVGSCADLAATVLRPLGELGPRHNDAFRLAPITVLVDPQRARALSSDSADRNLRFLFEKQVEEADLVCFSKADLFPGPPPALPHAHIRQLSARTGQGVAPWLEEIFSAPISGKSCELEIDYVQYAQAEAALAWLNLDLVFQSETPQFPPGVIGPWIDRLHAALSAEGIAIVHLKALAEWPAGFLKAAICSNEQDPEVEGNLDASPVTQMEVLLNLRALGDPALVGGLVERETRNCSGFDIRSLQCFSPSAPKPERRIGLPSPLAQTAPE